MNSNLGKRSFFAALGFAIILGVSLYYIAETPHASWLAYLFSATSFATMLTLAVQSAIYTAKA